MSITALVNDTISIEKTSIYRDILEPAANTESTQELKIYWLKRYEEIINNDLFQFNSQTIDLIKNIYPIARPSTPVGSIQLLNHLGANNQINEYELQNTIETGIRLLDSLLEVINFAPEARKLVTEYRKIGLSLNNFDEYASRASSDVESVDYLGNLISNSSYRASESLAEEKGPCQKWEDIKQVIRSKGFEYWYNIETGEIKSGVEVAENFDQESIKESDFEIVPRRNSHILLYPSDPKWQVWSDRDASKAKIILEKPFEPTTVIPTQPIKQEESRQDNQPINTSYSLEQVINAMSAEDVEASKTSEPINIDTSPKPESEENVLNIIQKGNYDKILAPDNVLLAPSAKDLNHRNENKNQNSKPPVTPNLIPLENVLPGIIAESDLRDILDQQFKLPEPISKVEIKEQDSSPSVIKVTNLQADNFKNGLEENTPAKVDLDNFSDLDKQSWENQGDIAMEDLEKSPINENKSTSEVNFVDQESQAQVESEATDTSSPEVNILDGNPKSEILNSQIPELEETQPIKINVLNQNLDLDNNTLESQNSDTSDSGDIVVSDNQSAKPIESDKTEVIEQLDENEDQSKLPETPENINNNIDESDDLQTDSSNVDSSTEAEPKDTILENPAENMFSGDFVDLSGNPAPEAFGQNSLLTGYQIGEIVQTIATGKYYQIIGLENVDNQNIFSLTSQDDGLISLQAKEEEIRPASLETLLNLVNNPEISPAPISKTKPEETQKILEPELGNNPSNLENKSLEVNQNGEKGSQNSETSQSIQTKKPKLKVDVLLLDEEGKIALKKLPNSSEAVSLPNFELKLNQSIDSQIQDYLSNQLGLSVNGLEEIGLNLDTTNQSISFAYFGQITGQLDQKVQDLELFEIEEILNKIENLDYYLEKVSKVELSIRRRVAIKDQEISDLRHELTYLRSRLQSMGINLQAITKPMDIREGIKSIDQNEADAMFLSTSPTTRFSKFLVYVEQLIQDKEVGDLLLKIQYDAFGPKYITLDIHNSRLNKDDNYLITTYINLINTSLASGASLADISYILGNPNSTFNNPLLQRTLLLVSQSISSFPTTTDNFSSNKLVVTILPKILESIKLSEHLLMTVTKDEPKN